MPKQSLRAALEEKRRREGEDCAARLEEARQRFRRSQERLKGLIREKEEKRDKERTKKEEGMKKSKQLKVEGELPAMVKKEKKIPVMKKVKKEVAPDLKKMDAEVPMEEDTNSKNDLLTAKEEVAPTVIKKKEKVSSTFWRA